MPLENHYEIAYFSMEIELESDIPTYSGGLGVLAGDMLRSAADAGVAMVAVSLVHRKGYFRQILDAKGQQTEQDDEWRPEDRLERLEPVTPVHIDGREVRVQGWKYVVRGQWGHEVPVILLDARVAGNSPEDAALTDHLYGGDENYRLCQEVILGLGGRRMLAELGLNAIRVYHMNEGHSSLLTLDLLEQQLGINSAAPRRDPKEDDVIAVRKQCVFTTHTPVPAGHDKFSRELTRQILGDARVALMDAVECWHDGLLNMTYLGLRFSRYINGVAMHHGEVSQGMFPGYPVHAITNGVDAGRWVSPEFQKLYDQRVPEWRRDNLYLRYAIQIGAAEIGETHQAAKRVMLAALHDKTGASLTEKVLTIVFARRAAQYKRMELLFSDLDRLRGIANKVGPLQIVYGGKAHPKDEDGKASIRAVFQAAEALRGAIEVVYVENYDAQWAALLTSGADLWLNTPHRPFEASGTSGMKAAMNGVPSLSILDGWWMEGYIQGVTGWAIGTEALPDDDQGDEIASLYDQLERVIVPMYYGSPGKYFEVMRSTIALNASFFNTQRMLRQYVEDAYQTH
jgi:glycogen phosphorylase